MLSINELSGDLGGFRVGPIDLTVEDGEYLVVLGPTGAGKTVLIEFIIGIHDPEKGRIAVNGQDITGLYTEERNIAYVPQDYALFPNLNVEKNIAYGLEAKRLPREEINRTVAEVIDKLGLDYIRHRMPLNLSGGEKQRVALGRALVTKPRLILLDEPLSALDENLRTEMARELRSLQQELEGTFIHVCHNFEEAADVADRIAIMDQGKFIQVGSLEEVMASPENEFVARFLKGRNIFPMESDGSRLKGGGDLVLEKETSLKGRVTAVIRPESVELLAGGDSGRGTNVLKARVEEVSARSHYTELKLDVGLPLVVYTTEYQRIAGQKELRVHIPDDKIAVFQNGEAVKTG